MSLPLIIWLLDDLSGAWHWAQGDRQGTAISESEKSGLGELETTVVRVVIAGQSIKQISPDLPPMKESDRRVAIGFAIENSIAAPLTSQHLVLTPHKSQDTSQKTIIIAHTKMTAIMSALSDAGIKPSGLYADFDVVSRARPLILPGRVIYPGPKGYTIDRDWAEAVDQEDPLSQILTALDFENALNLLTGEYTAKSKRPLSTVGMIRIAALFLVALTAWLTLQWTQSRAISQQASRLETEAASLYSAATGQPAPGNPALAVTRAVKGGTVQQADFLDLSSILFRALEQTDGIIVETLQFDRQKNQLSLRLVYPQFESAGALDTQISSAGGKFRSGGVREQSGRLIGDATLKAAP